MLFTQYRMKGGQTQCSSVQINGQLEIETEGSALGVAYEEDCSRRAERRAQSLPPDVHGRSRGPTE